MDIITKLQKDPRIIKKFPWIKEIHNYAKNEKINFLESVLKFLIKENYPLNFIDDVDLFISKI